MGTAQSSRVIETFEQHRPQTSAVTPPLHELPPSKVYNIDFLRGSERIELVEPSKEELQRKIAEASGGERRVIIGIQRDAAFAPRSNGTWTRLSVQNDAKVWALSLRSAAALGIRVHFTDFSLPNKAKLYLYSPQHPEYAQVYEGRGLLDKGDFWSTIIPGDTVAFELLDATGDATTAEYFRVQEISHLFKDAVGPLEPAGSCNLDASCYSQWTSSGDAVGRIIGTNGLTFACSGSLITNQAGDFSPMFLTASHCFDTDTVAQSAIVFWMYKSTQCNGTPPDILSVPQTVGAAFLSDGSPDATLLFLTGSVPSSIPFDGWTNVDPSVSSSITGIHHPHGSYRRISFGQRDSDDPSYINYHQVTWSSGITEPGSSGSPAFNSAHQIVGQLSLGSSSCSYPQGSDLYGKFSQTFAGLDRAYAEKILENGLPDTDQFGSHVTRATAATLSLPFPTTELPLKLGNDRWYKFNLPPYAKIVIHFAGWSGQTNSAVSLYSGTDTTPLSPVITSPDIVYRNGAQATDYYLQVHLQSGAYLHYHLGIDYYPAGPPTIALLAPLAMPTWVNISATLDTQGSPTQYWFEYGTDSNLSGSQVTPMTPASTDWAGLNTVVSIGTQASSLTPNTVYYYRVNASNSFGSSQTDIQSVSTPPAIYKLQINPTQITMSALVNNFPNSGGIFLKNVGNMDVTIVSASVTGDFTIDNSNRWQGCVASAFYGQSTCYLGVVFTPQSAGTYTGTLTVVTDDAGTFQIPITATAELPQPIVSIVMTDEGYGGRWPLWQQYLPLNMGEKDVYELAIENVGTAPLNVSNIVISGALMELDRRPENCSSAYTPVVNRGGTCTIYFTLQCVSPNGGPVYVTLTDNAPTSPDVMSFTINPVVTSPQRDDRPERQSDSPSPKRATIAVKKIRHVPNPQELKLR